MQSMPTARHAHLGALALSMAPLPRIVVVHAQQVDTGPATADALVVCTVTAAISPEAAIPALQDDTQRAKAAKALGTVYNASRGYLASKGLARASNAAPVPTANLVDRAPNAKPVDSSDKVDRPRAATAGQTNFHVKDSHIVLTAPKESLHGFWEVQNAMH